jgi:hypothetical protein
LWILPDLEEAEEWQEADQEGSEEEGVGDAE